MKLLVLFYGMTKRNLRIFFRYGFDTITQIVSLTILFAFLFYGAKAVIGGNAGHHETLPSIVSGYFVWMLAIVSYGSAAGQLTEEATTGTLEQLAMSPLGLRAVVTAQFLSSWLTQLVFICSTLLLMMTVSHQWLHIDFISLVPLVFLTSVGLFGMGLAVGGLSLVFKRTQNLQQLVQFAFVALVAVPVRSVPAFKFLPIAWGNELIRRVTVHGTSIFSMPLRDTGFLFVHAVAWFALGLIAFGRFERIARERALLGQY